jgi:predicted DNA-binding transcriptional regulator AlpA
MSDAPARWLDRDALAAYISVRADAVARLQKAGRLPAPSYHLGPRQPRWDRSQVDATLSGGVASTDPRTAINALANSIATRRQARPQAPR